MELQTCDQRIEKSLESTLETLRLFMYGPPECDECGGESNANNEIECDECGGEGWITNNVGNQMDCPKCKGTGYVPCPECSERWAQIEADLGARDPEELQDGFYEYGLSFDYVVPGTFTDQDQGYFRYQLSWGGPSDEFRFFTGPELEPYRIEYWFMDWSDGARRTMFDDDKQLLLNVWERFADTGTVQAEYESAQEAM